MDDPENVVRHHPMMSETIGNLAKALAAVQGKLKGAKKDSLNPHFRSSYADLASVWEACEPLLSENGLAVSQTFDGVDGAGRMILVSLLVHTSGEWISSRLAMPADKVSPQGFVAASTYARRAALSALVGVAPVDDDGESAEGRGSPPAVAARGAQKLASELSGGAKPKETLAQRRGREKKEKAGT